MMTTPEPTRQAVPRPTRQAVPRHRDTTEASRSMWAAIRRIDQPAFNPVEISTRSETVNILRAMPGPLHQPVLLRRYDTAGSMDAKGSSVTLHQLL